jgi:hypothetical protein
MSKSGLKALAFIGGVIALVLDLSQAVEHRRTCPKCIPRDYLTVGLDVIHLAELG